MLRTRNADEVKNFFVLLGMDVAGLGGWMERGKQALVVGGHAMGVKRA